MLDMSRVCAPASFFPAEGVSGAVADGAPSGSVPGAGVVAGAAVPVVVMVECSPRASKMIDLIPRLEIHLNLKLKMS